MNVKRYIPSGINDFLKSRKHIHIKWNKDLTSEIYELDYEGLVIACDTILRIAGRREIDKNNFVEIQSHNFHKILHHSYKLYLDYLISVKIIICDNHYISGEKSLGYKLNDNFVSDDRLNSISIDNKLFTKRTIAAIKSSDNKLGVSNSHSKNYLKSFKIDYNSAIEYLYYCYFNNVPDHKKRVLNKYTKNILEHKLNQINDGQLWINRSKTNGRINSNLSSLNGNFKKFIVGYDYSMDIVSSQPLLLNVLLNQIKNVQGQNLSNSLSLLSSLSYECKTLTQTLGKIELERLSKGLKTIKLPSGEEERKWKSLCECGELYEYFQTIIYEKTGVKLDRSKAKEIVISTMYSNSRMDNDMKKLFNATFPSIYKFLSDFKKILKIKRAHRILPIMMQSIESYIWVENILPELDRLNIPYLFIHDSVIIKKEDYERTDLKIMEVYYKFGVNSKIDVTDLKTEKRI
jgi:hypothetical protein